MKPVWNVFVSALALNFLVLAGAAGWLVQSGRLDKDKAQAIREIVFPKPVDVAPATQPAKDAATTQPSFAKLDELLAKRLGGRAGEQAEAVQRNADAQSAQLDRRRRELSDLQAQVASEQEALARANAAVEMDRQRLADERRQTRDAAADKGFDDSLQLYSSMPGRQAKQVFMGLPDETVVRYLQAMQPRTATKIVKEFKAPDEVQRINRLLERMRQGQPDTRPAERAQAADAREPKE